MKAVILAGGYGSRVAEETNLKPQPMVEIGGKPIVWRIMKIDSAEACVDTGEDSMTGGRPKRGAADIEAEEAFCAPAMALPISTWRPRARLQQEAAGDGGFINGGSSCCRRAASNASAAIRRAGKPSRWPAWRATVN